MTINIETLRFEIQLNKLDNSQMVLSPLVVGELLDRLEAAEQTVQDYLRIDREKAQIAQRLEAAEEEREELHALIAAVKKQANAEFRIRVKKEEACARLQAKIEAMEQQEPVAWVVPPSSRPHWGEHAMQDAAWEARQCGGTAKAEPLYALPGARPAPSVPREAIDKMLTQLMDIAVSNGANSISMPDEYVEVAAWLCGIPAQPAPSVPEVTDAMALAFHHALTDGSIGAREVEEIKDALRAALAAAPGSNRDDQHAGGLKALNHQGLMERARQNAKKEAGLIYPDDDARREEKEQELASEYYRQYTTPNP